MPEGPSCRCWPEPRDGDPAWVREKLAAEPAALRTLRGRMRSWVVTAELGDDLAESIVLVVDEAVTNAVEHACPDRECHVELVAGPRACGGGVAVLVADDGAWLPPGDPGYRGRGVTLMAQLADRASLEATDQGTTVRLCWGAPAPAPTD
ncbi:ATP-binding protein [Actinomycetospora sp. TBRC 11914]|uniref:ATP-binding protein n=1 Tax=Actinomycetospora sp. TBRC 11914 TaxID=2729387 RepID=UPI00145F5017|nr:ATP-binding protein [Actinomycetospora sp. TBRC 11914]NMO92340.1 ATP-binding protein [Actinomycetospora sp. TBRC 11914]